MKKTLLLIGLMAVTAACGDKEVLPPADEPAPPETALVELDASRIQIPKAGGSAQVTVTTNCAEWDYSCADTWLEITAVQNTLTLNAPANDGNERRTATVTVTAAGDGDDNTAEASLTVTQNGGALVIEVNVPDGATAIAPVTGDADCTIDWGDGHSDRVAGYIDGLFSPQPTHTYTQGGIYKISISGRMTSMGIGLSFTATEAGYITAVEQWGDTGLISMDRALRGCVNLARIPGDVDGSFTNVTEFSNAFYYCKSLTEIPADLFAYGDKITTFAFCFSGSGLKTIPEGLFDRCTAATNFISVFSGCPVLSLPGELFKACSAAETFSSAFYNCQLLQSIPESLFKGCTAADKFSYCFRSCPSLTEIPENLFADSPNATEFAGAFTACYSLLQLPEKLFAGNPEARSFAYCFMDCSSLTKIPAGLFDANRKATGFEGTFRDCISVSGESPYTEFNGTKVHLYERSKHPSRFAAPEKYEYCFSECTGLTDYEYMQQNHPLWSKTFVHSN